MSNIINVTKENDVYVRIDCEKGIAMELNDFFSFKVPNAHFIPAVRNKYWDGFIKLFNLNTKLLYYGLIPYLEEFCKDRNYELICDKTIEPSEQLSVVEAQEFIDSLNLPIKPHDYQIKSFINAIRSRRQLLLSPTASGKSLVIYLLVRWYETRIEGKILIIVPTISLVHQLAGDFIEYSKGIWGDREIHRITAGVKKDSDDIRKNCFISTWQSIYKLKREYFQQFNLVVGDETHLFVAKSLTAIMEKLTNCPYRVGTTGTIDDSLTNKLVLEGLFGPVKRVATTKELIDKKYLADFNIKCIVLKYPENESREIRKHKYHQEVEFLTLHNRRNRFIRNLAVSLKGNTLVLFRIIEHGKELYKLIKEKVDDERKVFFVYGGTDAQTREKVRAITETERNAIIVASVVFATGTNIRNLHNLVFSNPSKSRIRNLQSIGRGLRKGDNKTKATLYDIADDLIIGAHKNFTIRHFSERVKIYNSEQFPYKLYKVKLLEERKI